MRSKDDDVLIHDHAELGELLGQLIAALEANHIARAHGTLDLFWARLAMHIRAEHLHLFPAISNALSQSRNVHNDDAPSPAEAESTIERLHEDHDFFMREVAQAIAVTRSLPANPGGQVVEQLQAVRAKIGAVQARLVKHNEIEEKGIYLWTRSVLSEAEQSALAARVQAELENMPPRFGIDETQKGT